MKIGAEEKKKVAILCGLVLVGGYAFYANVLSQPGAAPAAPSDSGRAAAPAASRAPASSVAALPPAQQANIRRAGSRSRSVDDFRPSLKRRPEDQTDPMSIDPTLRLDLLAKVQGTALDGGSRNIFQFSAPPPPPAPKGPEPKIIPKIPGQVAANEQPKPDAGPPKPPPPPPINLKYYGYSTVRGTARKTAFFLDGEDILVAAEGETLKRRYKVVRIGVNSVVMEDTESKSQQTLPLAEEAAMG